MINEFLTTFLISMAPVVELRGGLPFGIAQGLPYPVALVTAVLGNMVPVPFIILYIRYIFSWLRRRSSTWDRLVTKLEQRAHTKGRLVTRYRFIGLMILVAIPLPGTGAWTGALVAAILDLRLKSAMPAITVGVIIAGFIVTSLTYGVTHLLG